MHVTLINEDGIVTENQEVAAHRPDWGGLAPSIALYTITGLQIVVVVLLTVLARG